MVVDGKALVADRLPVRDLVKRVAGFPSSPTASEAKSGLDGNVPPTGGRLTRTVANSVSALGGARSEVRARRDSNPQPSDP